MLKKGVHKRLELNQSREHAGYEVLGHHRWKTRQGIKHSAEDFKIEVLWGERLIWMWSKVMKDKWNMAYAETKATKSDSDVNHFKLSFITEYSSFLIRQVRVLNYVACSYFSCIVSLHMGLSYQGNTTKHEIIFSYTDIRCWPGDLSHHATLCSSSQYVSLSRTS